MILKIMFENLTQGTAYGPLSGLAIMAGINIIGYYYTKHTLSRIAAHEGRTVAIEEIKFDREFEAKNLGLRLANYVVGWGEKLAYRHFLAGKFS
jgi:hypothetical protein